MSHISASELVRNLPVLSSLPAVIDELEAALDRGDASMTDLGEIVKKDTDLTARLLRLANSSFYGFPKGVETVAEALSLIGLEQMKQLLTGSLVMEYFENIPASSVNMKTFWEHSIATGIAAKILSIQRRATEPELFFVSGLIHDIGRLVIYLKLPQESREILETYEKNNAVPLYEIEKNVIGFDHGDIGGELLKKWDFPIKLVEAVRYHHRPKYSEVHFSEAALINTANFVVNAIGIGSSGEKLVPPFDARAWERLDLSNAALKNTIKETQKQFSDVVTLFVR